MSVSRRSQVECLWMRFMNSKIGSKISGTRKGHDVQNQEEGRDRGSSRTSVGM